MKHPVISLSSLLVVGACISCNNGKPSGKAADPGSGKQNILILLADDQRADALGCAGNTYIRTPNIDNIAKNGIRFANAYVMGGHHGAISAPSRAMLMTGKYLHNVYDKLEGVKTMPVLFSSNGYETFATGKWHNEKNAFESMFQKGASVFLGGMSDHFKVPARDLADGRLSEPEMKGYSTDIFAEAAINFIKEYAAGDRKNPFFCYVAFTAPHDPYSPAPGYVETYADQTLPLPGNFMPLHPFQFDDLTVRDENLLPWPRDPTMVRSVLSDYYALITHLDSRIGDIIKALKDNSLFENTVIVYAADNGLAAGSHGLLGKQNLYEHSMKVPLIITGPGIPKGSVTEALVYLLDIYPTLAELCLLPQPDDIDGKSLVPVIRGDSNGIRNSLFTIYRNTVRAVRDNEWKLIRYPERNYNQLFNLKEDPLELNNLAGDVNYRATLDELFDLMEEWQIKANDSAALTAPVILPAEYDHKKLVRKPDQWQPDYTLNKYFRGKD